MDAIKYDWKKQERQYYLPKDSPELVDIPSFNFISIKGKGNPNEEFFADYIGVLYSLSYAIKMSPRQGNILPGYFDYAIYPLEGVWDIEEEARKAYKGTIDKNTLVFNMMIRQPEFVTSVIVQEIIERTRKKKPHELLNQVKFETIKEGKCIQMLHAGPYDNEPASFKRMEEFAFAQNLNRKSLIHREIYLSDARKTAPGKLKTVLRFEVE